MIVSKPKDKVFTIDLTGHEGNAMVLAGHAKRLAPKLGLDPDEIVSEMMSGDYENVIATFEYHFGEHVILQTDDDQLLSDPVTLKP